MKYLRYISIIISIFILLVSTLFYSSSHGRMHMDRIFSLSVDGSVFFGGEMRRQQIIGPLYIHMYQFNLYTNGVTQSKRVSFYSLGEDIVKQDPLIAFSEGHNYETTESTILVRYILAPDSNLTIETHPLNANFVTKTDPNYFRYISNGTGTMNINGSIKESQISRDTLISADSHYAYLRRGTKVQGYMGGFWGIGGTFDYFDISKVIARGKGETYEDHSYILSLDRDGKSKKRYGINFDEIDNIYLIHHDQGNILKVDKKNIIKIGQEQKSDTYYYFTGEDGDGGIVHGFLNFVK